MSSIAQDTLKLAKSLSAGGFSSPVFNKSESVVSSKRIANVMKRAGWLIDQFDFSKIQWDAADQGRLAAYSMTQIIWRVYPKGEFGYRNSDYVWGTVRTGLREVGKGVEVVSQIYVNG
jgi:hypothetical protein